VQKIRPYIILLFVFQTISSYSLIHFEKLKALESRVKYTYPDSLNLFSTTIDTSNHEGLAYKYWAKGKSAFWSSNFPEAYTLFEIAAENIEKTGKTDLLAELQLDLASSLSMVDQNGKALSYLLEANKVFSSIGSNEQKSISAIALAEMYRKLAEYENALNILHKIKSTAEKNPFTRAKCYNRIAAVHSETGSLDSSLFYSKLALKIAEEINDPHLIAISENEIGYVLRIARKMREALPHFYRADSLWQSVGMLRHAINAMHHISVCYGTLNELDESLEVTHKAYHLVRNKNWHQIEINLLEDLRNLQYQKGRIDSGDFYERKRLETVILWKDQQYVINTRMVEALFTQKQNEQTIREQTIVLENERLEKIAMERERTILWLLVGFASFLLVAIFGYVYIQHKRKKELIKQNIEKEQENLKLEKALSANEALFQEISHRVKNNLAVLSGILQMQSNISQNDSVKNELQNSILRIESMATIHKQLYDKDTSAKVNPGKAIDELSNNILHAMGLSPAECLTLSYQNFELDIAQSVPFCLILNEIITNSCKYAGVSSDKKLDISLSQEKNEIICIVKDKGVGFIDSDTEKKSLGIYLVKLLAKQLRADIKWEMSDEYFTFSIRFTNEAHE
jgi:two-component sensor histidine kinase